MSVNLSKNNEALVAAWASVVDDKSPTKWAIFGYEGQTNNLKVVGTGDGGLEEMIEDLNSGEIMYAFCRVIDTKTSLPKCLLINWQGEGAPIVRKGTCANHIRDVEKLLKGAHITINARSEEDVEVDLIMEKLARATGSFYKFREPRGKDVGNSGPVGTVYKRVIPEQEINPTERDEFWQKEEMEEKERVAEEKSRLERERKKKELEERLREEERNKIKEQQYTNKSEEKDENKSEARVQQLKNIRNQHMFNQNGADFDDDHKSRSDELRRQRCNETQQLIAQRTINARAVFEQNSAAGQMKTFDNAHIKKNIVRQTIDSINNPPAKVPVLKEAERNETVKSPVEPEIKQTVEEPHQPQQSEPASEPTNQDIYQNIQDITQENSSSNIETDYYNQLSDNYYPYFDPNDAGMKARALYDYQAADDTEITFNPGDVITNIDTIDEGWWQGLGPDGTYGLFPANYVEVIED